VRGLISFQLIEALMMLHHWFATFPSTAWLCIFHHKYINRLVGFFMYTGEAGASKEANDKEEEVRKILTAALERSKTYAKQ